MFGRLHLLLASACVVTLFAEGHLICVNTTSGFQMKGIKFENKLQPVIIEAGVKHKVVSLKYVNESAIEPEHCDVKGSSASACFSEEEEDDVYLHFMSRFSLLVHRTNATEDLVIDAAAFCVIRSKTVGHEVWGKVSGSKRPHFYAFEAVRDKYDPQ